MPNNIDVVDPTYAVTDGQDLHGLYARHTIVNNNNGLPGVFAKETRYFRFTGKAVIESDNSVSIQVDNYDSQDSGYEGLAGGKIKNSSLNDESAEAHYDRTNTKLPDSTDAYNKGGVDIEWAKDIISQVDVNGDFTKHHNSHVVT